MTKANGTHNNADLIANPDCSLIGIVDAWKAEHAADHAALDADLYHIKPADAIARQRGRVGAIVATRALSDLGRRSKVAVLALLDFDHPALVASLCADMA